MGVDEEFSAQRWFGLAAVRPQWETDFRKTKRSNATHASTTDKDARLFRKAEGQESRLAYPGHTLMENRNGLIVAADATGHRNGRARGGGDPQPAAARRRDPRRRQEL